MEKLPPQTSLYLIDGVDKNSIVEWEQKKFHASNEMQNHVSQFTNERQR
jgi:hypothetical protein